MDILLFRLYLPIIPGYRRDKTFFIKWFVIHNFGHKANTDSTKVRNFTNRFAPAAACREGGGLPSERVSVTGLTPPWRVKRLGYSTGASLYYCSRLLLHCTVGEGDYWL